jgi:hypothetical protein
MSALTPTYARFLNELRASGKINMFEAPLYLCEIFELSHAQARVVFMEWATTFSQE